MTPLDIFQMKISKHEMYPENDTNVKEVLKGLTTAPIVSAGAKPKFIENSKINLMNFQSREMAARSSR